MRSFAEQIEHDAETRGAARRLFRKNGATEKEIAREVGPEIPPTVVIDSISTLYQGTPEGRRERRLRPTTNSTPHRFLAKRKQRKPKKH